MAKTVIAENLREGTTILVEGKVAFSRIASLIEGDELVRRNQNRKGFPVDRPHTSLSLKEAKVVPADPSGVLNPEETFIQESFFTSPANPDHGQKYSIDNKSPNLPHVWVLRGAAFEQVVELEGEIDRDTLVRIALQVFKPKQYNKRGIRLNDIFIPQPEIPYFRAGGTDTAGLAAFGITLASQPKPTIGAAAPAQAQPQGDQIVGTDDQGLPSAPVQSAPAAQAPVAPAPAAAPVAPQAPAASVADPFSTGEAAAAPAAPAAPASNPWGGIPMPN